MLRLQLPLPPGFLPRHWKGCAPRLLLRPGYEACLALSVQQPNRTQRVGPPRGWGGSGGSGFTSTLNENVKQIVHLLARGPIFLCNKNRRKTSCNRSPSSGHRPPLPFCPSGGPTRRAHWPGLGPPEPAPPLLGRALACCLDQPIPSGLWGPPDWLLPTTILWLDSGRRGLREPALASVYLLHLLSGRLVHGFLVPRWLLLKLRTGGPEEGLWRVLQVHLGWWARGWRTRLGRGLAGEQ